MTKKYRQPVPKKRPVWQTVKDVLGWIGWAVGIVSFIYAVAVQIPESRQLSLIKHDFPMVQDYSEAQRVASQITRPESQSTHIALDYNVVVLIQEEQVTPMPFQNARYGFLLRLSTDNVSYAAIDSSLNPKQIPGVFTIAELRAKRGLLAWIPYNGPIPPKGWLTFK